MPVLFSWGWSFRVGDDPNWWLWPFGRRIWPNRWELRGWILTETGDKLHKAGKNLPANQQKWQWPKKIECSENKSVTQRVPRLMWIIMSTSKRTVAMNLRRREISLKHLCLKFNIWHQNRAIFSSFYKFFWSHFRVCYEHCNPSYFKLISDPFLINIKEFIKS